MIIEIIGSGCATCKQLLELTRQAAEQAGIGDEVEYVTDIGRMIELNIMQTPVIAVDGKVVHSGKPLPSVARIRELLQPVVSGASAPAEN